MLWARAISTELVDHAQLFCGPPRWSTGSAAVPGSEEQEIAAALNIYEGSIKVYLSRLFRKLGVKDRLDLAPYGLRSQMAPLRQPPRPFLLERVPFGSLPGPQQPKRVH